MPALDEFLRKKLAALDEQHARRLLHTDTSLDPVTIERDGKRYVSFASNNYLGLTHHPDVIAAGTIALQKYGAGGGASRLVTGNHPLYEETEALLANMKNAEKALIFGSGYMAHGGLIPALVGKGDLIVLDEFSHASMIDAAKLSGAALLRFSHNNPDDLENTLKTYRKKYTHCLIATETVFSMDGDLAPLDSLQTLATTYNCWLLTDEAHTLLLPPVRGKAGMGVGLSSYSETVEAPTPSAGAAPPTLPLKGEGNIIRLGTLSKAIGAYGGYVLGSETLIDYLITAARPFIFTTSLPPAVLATAKAALEVIQKNPGLCAKPLEHARYFCELAGLPPAQSAIVPLILGGNEKALRASDTLKENGFLVPAIRPPTVPKGTARLRFSFSAAHEKADIARLAALVKV